MTFSVLIPAYNGEKFLMHAIESVLEQGRPADEIIVLDDASQDGTARIAARYKDRIKYFYHPEPTGFVDAWNRAIARASCDFVTILHQTTCCIPIICSTSKKQ